MQMIATAVLAFISNWRCAIKLYDLPHRSLTVGLLLILTTALPGCTTPRVAAVTQGVVIENVTIVDPRDGRLASDMSIVVNEGKIVRIERAQSEKASGSAQRVNGRGKFVVPGYLDMHSHALNSRSPETSLPLMLANGVTGFRQMAGSPEQLEQRRQGKSLTPPISPELLAMPGLVLAGMTPEAAVAEVRVQKSQGADFIKTVELGRGAFLAAEDEATAVGLPYVGHLPQSVDVREAVSRGMRSIEHLGTKVSILISCSSDEAAIRQMIANTPPAPPRVSYTLPQAALKRLTANPLLSTDKAGFALFQRVINTYDSGKCRALAEMLAASDSWQVPTLIRLKAQALGDDPQFKQDPNDKDVPADVRQMWSEVAEDFSTKFSPAEKAILNALFSLQLKLVKVFDQAGVKMLTGTDFGGQWLVAGVSLHQEFDLLEQAGVSPLHVLQMTTINGAKFLHREASMGTVEPGKEANLVLLDANPLASVQSLHKINAVVRAGTYYSRAALDEMAHRAEQATQAP